MSASRESLTKINSVASPVAESGRVRRHTSRHKLEPMLPSTAEILSALTDNIPDRLLLLDLDFKILFANRAIFDVTREELLGRSILEFLPDSDRERVSAIYRQAVVERAPKIYELCHMVRGESRWFENRLGPVISDGQVVALTIASSEITARRRNEEALRILEREITEIANREQRRIGSDLHDGLGQELTGIALMARSLTGLLRKEDHAAAELAEEIVGLVNNTIESTRSLARGLAPVSIERGGLPFALRSLAARTTDTYGVRVRFHSKIWPQLTLEASSCNHLYRIAQEAISNAVKHGQAQEIVIDLTVQGERVVLSISDDGCGFAPNANLTSGMGLKIMQYRAHTLGGNVSVQPRSGGGTRLLSSCLQPLPAELQRPSRGP